jgi:hypothetical protein
MPPFSPLINQTMPVQGMVHISSAEIEFTAGQARETLITRGPDSPVILLSPNLTNQSSAETYPDQSPAIEA